MKKYLTFPFLIRIGLGCAFLSQALVAFTEPSEFQELISASLLSGFLPISAAAFVTIIGINDLIVALLLFTGWRTHRVAVWAAFWIVGVIVVIGIVSIDALEHLAFYAMALALIAQGDPKWTSA